MKYIYKMNAKLPPINRRRLRKKEQIKEEKTKENIFKANGNCNDWKLQLHWDNIEWVGPNNRYHKNNTSYTSTYNLYIKYGNKSCNFVGH